MSHFCHSVPAEAGTGMWLKVCSWLITYLPRPTPTARIQDYRSVLHQHARYDVWKYLVKNTSACAVPSAGWDDITPAHSDSVPRVFSFLIYNGKMSILLDGHRLACSYRFTQADAQGPPPTRGLNWPCLTTFTPPTLVSTPNSLPS